MIEKLFPLKFPPGFYRNGTKYEAKGRWFHGNLVRFYEGAIRPVQGWRIAFDSDGDPLAALEGIPRAALGWRSAAGVPLLAVGTTKKLYIIKEGVTYDITPEDFDGDATNDDASSGGVGNGTYGNGDYGAGLYGVGRAPLSADLTDADTWQLDAIGDVLVAVCTNGGRMYVWTGDTSAVAVVAAGSPEPNRGVVITPERFVFALGSESDVREVKWADQASFEDWTPTDENAAGFYDIVTNGRIMCGRRTKAQTLIFTDADMHSATYIGGTFVYSFKQEGDNCGIISPQAVAVVDTTAMWMGRDNFYGYDGFVKPIPCSVHDYVFDDFNEQQASKVFACPVSEFSEIWWFYPSAGATENDRYVVFNYRENHWTTGLLGRSAAIDRGALPNAVMFDANGVVYEHELGAGTRTLPLATLLSDALEDTDAVALEDHSAGITWEADQGSLVFDGNTLKRDGTDEPRYLATDDIGTDSYEASVDAFLSDGPYPDATFGGVGVRMAAGSPEGYAFGFRTDTTPVFVLRGRDSSDADLFTELTVPVPAALVGTVIKLTTAVAGANIYGFANGVLQLQVTNAALPTGQPGVFGGWPFTQAINPSDTFTDANGTGLEAHTPEGGFTWVDDDLAHANLITVDGNGAVVAQNVSGAYRAAGLTPAVDEMTIDFDILENPPNIFLLYAILRGEVKILDAASQGYKAECRNDVGVGFEVTLTRNNTVVAGPSVASVAALAPGSYVYRLRIEDDGVGGVNVISSFGGVDFQTYNDPTPLTTTECGIGLSRGSGGTTNVISLSQIFLGPTLAVESAEYFVGPYTVRGNSSVGGGGNVTIDPLTGEISLVPFIESGPIEIDDGDNVARVQRIVPDEKNLGDVEARFFTAMYPTANETERGPFSLANPTSVRFTCRQLRIRLEEVVATNWRIGVTRLGVIIGGRR